MATANAADFLTGRPIANPMYLVDASGNPITSSNGMPIAVTLSATSIAIEDGTTPTQKLAVDASGRLTLVPNSSVNAAQIGGQVPTLDNTAVLAVSLRGKGNGTAGDTALLLSAAGRASVDINSFPLSTVPVSVVAGTALAPGNNAMPILTSASTGYVAAWASNPAALTSSTDYSFKWGASGTTQVNHIMLQNNTAATLNWDLDVAANAGSPTLAAGQTVFLDVQTTVLHLFQAGTPNVGGSSSGNIVVRGWI